MYMNLHSFIKVKKYFLESHFKFKTSFYLGNMSAILALVFLLKVPQFILAENSTGHEYGKYSVSGFPASIVRYPSAVYLESPRSKCTGTLISKQFILTAAHCLKRRFMLAYIGHSLKHCGRIHVIKSVNIHPRYKLNNVNDIAVLKLKKPIKISKMVKLLHMADKKDVFPVGTRCLIAGWGRLSRAKKRLTNKLHYGLMKIVNPKYCQGKSSFNQKREICAGKIRFLQNITGKGDSGTALRCYRKSDGKLVVAGVDSRAPTENLTIFTKVSFYRDWLDSKIRSLKNKHQFKKKVKNNYKTYIFVNIDHQA